MGVVANINVFLYFSKSINDSTYLAESIRRNMKNILVLFCTLKKLYSCWAARTALYATLRTNLSSSAELGGRCAKQRAGCITDSLAEPRLLGGALRLRTTCSLLQEFLQGQSDCRIFPRHVNRPRFLVVVRMYWRSCFCRPALEKGSAIT